MEFIRTPKSRAEWRALRKNYVGGSDSACLFPNVLGFNGKDASGLWLDKTNKEDTGDDGITNAMMAGTKFEETIAELAAQQLGLTVRRLNFMVTDGRMLANVDRMACVGEDLPVTYGRDGMPRFADGAFILECKLSCNSHLWDEGVPMKYQVQVQHYMEVLNLDKAVVAVVFADRFFKFEAYTVLRDKEVGAAIRAAVTRFWTSVEAGECPDAVSPEAAAQAWTKAEAGKTAQSEELSAAIDRLRSASSVLDAAKGEYESAKAEVMNGMKDAEIALDRTGNKAYTWKNSTSLRLDTKAAKAALGNILDPYYKESVTRTFRAI